MPLINSSLLSIDRRSSVDYAQQIRENIKALILNQTYYYNFVLPTISTLSTQLDVKEGVVLSAYKLLEKENLVKKEKGNYIISYIELTNYFFERNTSIVDAIISLGLTPSIKCLQKKVVTLSDEEATKKGFQPNKNKKYLYINRIYYGSNHPIIILENYLPLHIFKNMENEFQGHEGLNHYIGETYGFKAHISKRVTKIVNLDQKTAKLLNERVNAASLQSTNNVYDKQGRMIDYGQSHSVSSYYFQALVHCK